MGAGDVVE
ncbi:hypothetical protein HaLaN_16572, partial [Haematococcus lacustris]